MLAAAVFAADWVERQSEASSDARARERLTLYRETLLRELEKFRYLPYLVARDPRATAVLDDPGEADAANLFLKELAAATGAEALFVMNAKGRTVAASNFDTASSFMGRNYAFRPYFQTAISGARGNSSQSAPQPASPASSLPAPRRRPHPSAVWSSSRWT
ncbi:MAG: hypothetical protein HPM95_12565 [Alphaproteobacteria bacterium]|nr:hypothetical protein [Alphaproteobacteria bacterium]